jgi:hypothetical protein
MMGKKIITLIVIVIFLFEITYAYVPVKCKASYVAGSLSIKLKGKGILQVGENSLVFIYKNHKHEIPYENIKHMHYSKKIGSLKSIRLPKINPRYYEKQNSFSGPSLIEIILLVVSGIALVAVLIFATGKYVYLNVAFDVQGEDNWATFKIKKDHFQKIFLTLSSKSGKDIAEIF